MSDLVVRLRRYSLGTLSADLCNDLVDAADEIERLRDIKQQLDRIETLIKRNGS